MMIPCLLFLHLVLGVSGVFQGVKRGKKDNWAQTHPESDHPMMMTMLNIIATMIFGRF